MTAVKCALCPEMVDESARHEMVGVGVVCAGCCECAGFVFDFRRHSIGNLYSWEGPDDRDLERSYLVDVGCDGATDSYHGSVTGQGNVFGGEVECPGCGRLLVFDMAGTQAVNVREVTP